jgi:Flp pilus assembly protein TadD
MQPEFAEAHNNLGIALAAQGRVKDAAKHFFTALQIQPHSASAHNNMGLALAHQGQLAKAVHHFSEAVRLEPGYTDARHNLAVVSKELGPSGGITPYLDQSLLP